MTAMATVNPGPFHREAFSDSKVEEPAATIRQQLGLRPSNFIQTGHKGTHPDVRPCPEWCWGGNESDPIYEHEVVAAHPLEALHNALEGSRR